MLSHPVHGNTFFVYELNHVFVKELAAYHEALKRHIMCLFC